MSRTYADLSGLMTVMTGDEKHGPSATSTLDVLWVLYDQVLRVAPDTAGDPGRDRFLLSKGHGPAAYYAVLAAKGFFPESWLASFGAASSPLGYHPDRSLVPGVEIASGSLGHGLPLGVGLAHGLLAQGLPGPGLLGPRVYVLVGDAELDEGSNHEAIVYAGAVRLPNLTVVAVDNQSSSYGWGPGGIEAHFAVSGWSAVRVSGRDHAALASAFRVTAASDAGPQLVVATVEGKALCVPICGRCSRRRPRRCSRRTRWPQWCWRRSPPTCSPRPRPGTRNGCSTWASGNS